VKNGYGAYERDSVVFDTIQYSWPLLAGLLWTAAATKGRLHVLDFGGSLGSTYLQNRKFLSSLDDLIWSVVEQREFVDAGKAHMEDGKLKFYTNLDTCVRETHPNVFVFSCVLQYLKSPYDWVESTVAYGPQTILVDNMAFTDGKQRLTVQRVPPQIYPASYPCWILNREQFMKAFRPAYDLVEHFESPLAIRLDGNTVPYEGFIFRKATP
jgi:putative methyltransferase (TIGR04325 family)